MTTIRELVDGLTELAGMVPDGPETVVQLWICDGTDLELIETVDLDRMSTMPENGSPVEYFALLRGHLHPGRDPGEVLRGAATGADEELRGLTGEGD